MDVPGRGTLNPELRTLNFELSVGFVFIKLFSRYTSDLVSQLNACSSLPPQGRYRTRLSAHVGAIELGTQGGVGVDKGIRPAPEETGADDLPLG